MPSKDPVPDESDSGESEIQELKNAIGDLETLIAKADTNEPKSGAEIEDLMTQEDAEIFSERIPSSNSLPDEGTDPQGPYQQLGTTQEGRTVRGPRVRNAKTKRRRSGVKTIRSDWQDVRKSQLSSLSQSAPTAAESDEPVESRSKRIAFEEERSEEGRKLGREMARATLIARVIAGVIFLSVLGGIVSLALNAQNRSNVDTRIQEEDAYSSEIESLVTGMSTAKQFIRNFWEAPTLQDKATFVWNPQRVLPLMEQYYRREILPTKDNIASIHVVSNRTNHRHSELPANHLAGFVTDDVGAKYPIILRPDGRSKHLIDWEASVGYNDSDLSYLINNREANPVSMRLLVSLATYYNYQYSDYRTYQSYKIKVADRSEPSCYGFARRDSEVFKKLSTLFANREPRTVAVTLRLRFPPGREQGAELLGVEKLHWVLD